jgi:prepilin peptidase CpaA
MPADAYLITMLAALVPATAYACWKDCRTHRVANWLNASIAATGLAAQWHWFGTHGLTQGLLGIAVGFALLFGLWLIRGMGAGDVKFMAALGAWLGPMLTLYAVAAGGIFGGVLALGMIAVRRTWLQTGINLAALFNKLSSARTALSDFASARSLGRTSGVLPYAVPLTAGMWSVVVIHYCGWWDVL